ncbi:MAG: aminoacetone oxidase family FAD-binding enzyme [Chitinivibrionales bacterium]|nr:aminoacetone oxidase family FAD-binding enzyme [Chitinivibrionales bacterium]
MQNYDCIIIGAGPAGIMAAIGAAAKQSRVAIIEKNTYPGAKLRIAGGGRCNLSNAVPPSMMAAKFGSQKSFVKNALYAFDSNNVQEFFSSIERPTVIDENNRIYPASMRGVDVVSALEQAARSKAVDILLNTRLEAIVTKDGSVSGVRASGNFVSTPVVICASGGMTWPQAGGSSETYDCIRPTGHTIVEPRCALAGLHIDNNPFRAFAGISLDDCELSIAGAGRRSSRVRCRGELVITHKGLSGPVALDISGEISRRLYSGGEVNIDINFIPLFSEDRLAAQFNIWRKVSGGKLVKNVLSELLPQSLAGLLCNRCDNCGAIRMGDLGSKVQHALIQAMTSFPVRITSVDSKEKAMVTSGGVIRDEIDPRTMQSRRINGLYFCGEVIDVDGPCGGYNIHWALASGYAAGNHAAAYAANTGTGENP